MPAASLRLVPDPTETDLEESISPLRPPVDADVVVLPSPRARPQPPRSRPSLARTSRFHLVSWPVLGAGLTAAVMVVLRPEDPAAAEAVAEAVAEAADDEARPTTAAPREPAPPAAEPNTLPEPIPDAPAAVLPAPSAESWALADARVLPTQTHLVYRAPTRPRDWYAAMNLCRRRHAGLDGWTTPTSRELHALAKLHALPPDPLWSRTRSARSPAVAFVVHGRAGRTQGTPKAAQLDAAVCIRKRTDAPDPG